jgi:hypothetical protein
MKLMLVTKRGLASYLKVMDNEPLLDWDDLVALGVDLDWRNDAPVVQPERSAHEPEVDVTDTE